MFTRTHNIILKLKLLLLKCCNNSPVLSNKTRQLELMYPVYPLKCRKFCAPTCIGEFYLGIVHQLV